MIIAVLHPKSNACREKFPDAKVKCWGVHTFKKGQDMKTRYPVKFLLDIKKFNPDYILVDGPNHTKLTDIIKKEFPRKKVVNSLNQIPVPEPKREPEPEPVVEEVAPEPEPEPEEEVMDPEEMFSG